MKYLIGLALVFIITAHSQQRYLVTPSNEAIPLLQGESALEAANRAGILSSDNVSRGFNPQQFPTELEFPTYHKMAVGMWFTAPATGSLDSVFWMGGDCGALESLVYIRFHESTVGDDRGPGIAPYPPPCQPWGYWKSIYDNDQGVAAYREDVSDTTWYSTINENQNGQVVPKTRPHFEHEIWGTGCGAAVTNRRGLNKLWLGINDLPCSLTVGDKFFISFRINSGADHVNDYDRPTTWPASISNAPDPSRAWVFYEHSGEWGGYKDPMGLQIPCGGVDPAPNGWIAMGGPRGDGDAMAFNWWYVMSTINDVPPSVVQYDKLSHTFSTAPRNVSAEIIDANPADPGDAGVASVYLIYSINNNSEDSVLMTNTSGDVWSGSLPSLPAGSEVMYHLSATDVNGNRNTDCYNRYRVYTLANDYYVVDRYALYQWEEINSSGVKITDWLPKKLFGFPGWESVLYPDSNTSAPIDLGAGSFNFFGSYVRYSWIGVDGNVSFSNSLTDTNRIDQTNDLYPAYAPEMPCDLFNNTIAPMFKAFNIKKHGAVYYKDEGNKFIVEWDSVCAKKDYSDTTTTFEMILDRTDNSITFLYKDIGKYLASGDVLVAIQADSTKFCFVNRNGSPPESEIHNGHAVKFYVNDKPSGKWWGMYSTPVKLSDPSKDQVFINSLSDAFTYVNGRYETHDTIRDGVGYWLKLIGSHYVPIEGLPILLDTVDVVEGWNMIGSISVPIPTLSITSDPPGITTSDFFGYSSSYTISDTIYPGNGYWVKVNQPGILILSSTPPLQTYARIRIIPTSDLPPSPPGEKKEINEIPKEFSLSEAYPNPFNPTTIIKYDLPKSTTVTLKVYNLLGQVVQTLMDNKQQEAGQHEVMINAEEWASGIYFYKIITENDIKTKKMLLLR